MGFKHFVDDEDDILHDAVASADDDDAGAATRSRKSVDALNE